VIEAGLNGRTSFAADPPGSSSACSSAPQPALSVALHSHKPLDIVVLALGANDLQRHLFSSIAKIVVQVANLAATIQQFEEPPAQPRPPKLLVVGPPRLHETQWTRAWGFDHIGARAEELNTALKAYCDANGIAYVDCYGHAAVTVEDGVHFSPTGHDQLSAMVAQVVFATVVQ
jgi:lysophospholipase L1-like esterase